MFTRTLFAGALALATSMTALPAVQAGPLGPDHPIAPIAQKNDTKLVQVAARWDNKQTNRKWKKRVGNKDGSKHNMSRHWDRKHDGNRYAYKHDRYRHYHNGYYYASPWWLLPTIGLIAPRVGYTGGSHVQYCEARFQSYDRASDTYLGFDGFRHRCYGP